MGLTETALLGVGINGSFDNGVSVDLANGTNFVDERETHYGKVRVKMPLAWNALTLPGNEGGASLPQ